MTGPGPHANDETLHPRLTVALVPTPADEVEQTVARLGAEVIDEAGLRRLVDEVVQIHAPGRASAVSALQTAADGVKHDLDQAIARSKELRETHRTAADGAEWAEQAVDSIPRLRADVQETRAALDAAEAEQRQARAALERVLEQSAAAGAAMEEANRELAELTVVGMDESRLRRELEASGEAVRNAQAAHEAATQRLAALQAEWDATVERLDAFEAALSAHAATALVDPETVEAVRRAYEAWKVAVETAEPDQFAQDLADALTDLHADLEQLGQDADTVDPAELAAAEARVAQARQAVEDLRSAAAPAEMDAAARAELDAIHDEVLQAEERTGRRIGGSAARKQLEEARAKEQALLERYGFASYIDVVLTGGRQTPDDPRLLGAEQELRSATDALSALRASVGRVSPERAYLDGEQARLMAEAAKVLGSEPGPDVIDRLRAHRRVDAAVEAELRRLLEGAGVSVDGHPATAAAVWLDEQSAQSEEHDRWTAAAEEARSEVAALRTRRAELEAEIPAAQQAAASAAEELEMSARSVGAFEAELSVRADEDAKRLKRLAAAEQLRAQVEAMSNTLAKAESSAREALEAASVRVTEAERAVGQAQRALADVADRARRLSALVPTEGKGHDDPLDSLPALATGLRTLATATEAELAEAEAAEAEVTRTYEEAVARAEAAAAGAGEAIDSDWVEALEGAVTGAARRTIVLDRALDDVSEDLHHDLLQVLAEGRTTAPVVLLTTRTDTVGWAIELPDSVATVRSLDTVLNSAGLVADKSPATDLNTNGPAHSAGRR